MDGYAVRARDVFGASESEPGLLRLCGEIAMGQAPHGRIEGAGACYRIWTGGVLPPGADAVVMLEYTRLLDEQTLKVFRPVAPGENVIRRGEDSRRGATVLPAGHRLRPQDIGVLAGLGVTAVEVHRRPTVAIVSTGDELVPPGQALSPGRIRDINSTTLAASSRLAGCRVVELGIVADDFDQLLERTKQGLAQADVVLLSGGSSVGRRDYTLRVVEAIDGAELLAHGVAVRPGKPTILAKLGNQAVVGLPGHVASAMVIFHLFVQPLLSRLAGAVDEAPLIRIQAVTAEPIASAIGREEYVRVALDWRRPGTPPVATPVYGRSGLLMPLVQADGLLVIGRDVEGLDEGALADVLLFPRR